MKARKSLETFGMPGDPQHSLEAIFQRNGVEICWIFGSAGTGNFGPDSDVDLLLRFKKDKGDYFSRLISLREELEAHWRRKVDLLVEDGLRNPILKREIEQTREVLYGPAN